MLSEGLLLDLEDLTLFAAHNIKKEMSSQSISLDIAV